MELKYTFNTLEEIKQAIEKWFKDCGYDGPEKTDKQYLKIIAEIGEMSDALCKEDFENFKSEAGDVFVTILGYCLQKNIDLKVFFIEDDFKRSDFVLITNILLDVFNNDFENSIDWLSEICFNKNTTLLECATIAYNKIQGRLERGELKVINGTIAKGN